MAAVTPPPSRFSRWSDRKSKARRGEEVELQPDQDQQQAKPDLQAATDPDDQLSDDELLSKHDLPDPQTVNSEEGLDRFFGDAVPERLKTMAYRRLWRLNPLFRYADEMVEYGENYTDAATVMEGMQTAYQVGKGYLVKLTEQENELLPDDAATDNPDGEGDNSEDANTDDNSVKNADQKDKEEAKTASEKDMSDNSQTDVSGGMKQEVVEEQETASIGYDKGTDTETSARPVDPAGPFPDSDTLVKTESPRPARMIFRRG